METAMWIWDGREESILYKNLAHWAAGAGENSWNLRQTHVRIPSGQQQLIERMVKIQACYFGGLEIWWVRNWRTTNALELWTDWLNSSWLGFCPLEEGGQLFTSCKELWWPGLGWCISKSLSLALLKYCRQRWCLVDVSDKIQPLA